MRPTLVTVLTALLFATLGCRTTRIDAPERAEEVSRRALPSDTGNYVGYQVGGGCSRPRQAEPGGPDEGTWGWDYSGWLIHRRVMSGWWHGRRDQGGSGAYQTDGPRLYQEAGRGGEHE